MQNADTEVSRYVEKLQAIKGRYTERLPSNPLKAVLQEFARRVQDLIGRREFKKAALFNQQLLGQLSAEFKEKYKKLLWRLGIGECRRSTDRKSGQEKGGGEVAAKRTGKVRRFFCVHCKKPHFYVAPAK